MEIGVNSKKLPHYGLSFRKTTAFFNFSKNYHKSGWLFQKTQVAERLRFNWGYDMWGPPVRVLSATVLTARGWRPLGRTGRPDQVKTDPALTLSPSRSLTLTLPPRSVSPGRALHHRRPPQFLVAGQDAFLEWWGWELRRQHGGQPDGHGVLCKPHPPPLCHYLGIGLGLNRFGNEGWWAVYLYGWIRLVWLSISFDLGYGWHCDVWSDLEQGKAWVKLN